MKPAHTHKKKRQYSFWFHVVSNLSDFFNLWYKWNISSALCWKLGWLKLDFIFILFYWFKFDILFFPNLETNKQKKSHTLLAVFLSMNLGAELLEGGVYLFGCWVQILTFCRINGKSFKAIVFFGFVFFWQHCDH